MGDELALYTDGITEAADETGEEFGPERLRELLGGNEGRQLQDQHARVLSSVREHASGKLTDDATLLLISLRGGQSRSACRPEPAARVAIPKADRASRAVMPCRYGESNLNSHSHSANICLRVR